MMLSKILTRSVACGLTAASVAFAQIPPSAPPLSLSQAVAIALQKNPTLQAEGFRTRIADARLDQAGTKPNPELAVGIEPFLGTGELSGVKSMETTLQLSQVIDLGGTRLSRVQVAEEEKVIAGIEFQLKRVDVLAEVARRFTEAAADTQRLKTAQRAREIGEQTVAAVRRRIEATVASPIELNKARTALAVLQIEEEHAEHELAVCRQALAAMLGERAPTFGEISANLLELPGLPDFEALADRLESSPALRRFAAEERWHEAQERLAQSLNRAGMRVSGGIRRVENTDAFGFVAGVSIPLPVRNQQAGVIREARERRAQLAPAMEATKLELRATLFEVYQEMRHARTALKQLQSEVIPLAEETLNLTEKGYREGRFAFLDLLNAQQSLVSLRNDAVANAAAFHLHVVTIERLLGGPIQNPSSNP